MLACIKAEKKNMSIGAILKLKAGAISKYDSCEKSLIMKKQEYEDFSRHFKSHVKHVMKFMEGSMLLTMAKAHAEKE